VKVTIVRGGGVAGFVTRTELNTDALSRQDAEALAHEVAKAGIQDLREPPAMGSRHPDSLLYEIVLEDDGDRRTLRFSEETLPEEVRSLVAWIDSRPERTDSVET
jgi:hypothetical protein